MYRKILYIPQPCTRKIKERERDTEGGGGRERGERGGEMGERGGERGGREEKKTNLFFFRANEWQTSTKTPAPLIFL